MKISDPLLTQDENPKEIFNLNPDEILDLEEEEDSTILTINDDDAKDDMDLEEKSGDDKDDRITGVHHSNKTMMRNHKYFNEDVINTMTTKEKQPESHSGRHKDPNQTCEDHIVTGVF